MTDEQAMRISPAPPLLGGPHRATSRCHRTSLRALQDLPVHLRVVVVLRYYADLSEREIATAIGRRQGTVKSRLHEARRVLAEHPALQWRPTPVDPQQSRRCSGDHDRRGGAEPSAPRSSRHDRSSRSARTERIMAAALTPPVERRPSLPGRPAWASRRTTSRPDGRPLDVVLVAAMVLVLVGGSATVLRPRGGSSSNGPVAGVPMAGRLRVRRVSAGGSPVGHPRPWRPRRVVAFSAGQRPAPLDVERAGTRATSAPTAGTIDSVTAASVGIVGQSAKVEANGTIDPDHRATESFAGTGQALFFWPSEGR